MSGPKDIKPFKDDLGPLVLKLEQCLIQIISVLEPFWDEFVRTGTLGDMCLTADGIQRKFVAIGVVPGGNGRNWRAFLDEMRFSVTRAGDDGDDEGRVGDGSPAVAETTTFREIFALGNVEAKQLSDAKKNLTAKRKRVAEQAEKEGAAKKAALPSSKQQWKAAAAATVANAAKLAQESARADAAHAAAVAQDRALDAMLAAGGTGDRAARWGSCT
jgi:hypothetical protein